VGRKRSRVEGEEGRKDGRMEGWEEGEKRRGALGGEGIKAGAWVFYEAKQCGQMKTTPPMWF
jgi:hypothetical protein